VRGLAPLACKTDRIDAWGLAELARRDLVPVIWLLDPRSRLRELPADLEPGRYDPPLSESAYPGRRPHSG
jgi:hypothetical protein